MQRTIPTSFLLSLMFGASLALAQTPATPAPKEEIPPAPKPLSFHPPRVETGVLPLRVGGGSRGSNTGRVALVTLVPDSVVFTSEAKPTLYWYQSDASPFACQITVTEPKKRKPLLTLKSEPNTTAGIHSVRLADHPVELTPNVIYLWSVAVIVDPKNRSQDVIASGMVERKELSPEIAAQLSAAAPADKLSLYAEHGYWYDALQILSEQIDRDSKSAALHAQRAGLLTSVGLQGEMIEKSSRL